MPADMQRTHRHCVTAFALLDVKLPTSEGRLCSVRAGRCGRHAHGCPEGNLQAQPWSSATGAGA